MMVTRLCNMACRHCCYSAARSPRDLPEGTVTMMSMDTFRAALEWAPTIRNSKGVIPRLNIGGGEPTVHPRLFEMLDMAIGFSREHGMRRPWIVTNGKRKTWALRLAGMAEEGLIQCGLSQDRWHQKVSEEVVRAFTSGPFESYKESPSVGDGRFVHGHGRPIAAGRARNLPWNQVRLACNGCGRPWVLPDGSVAQCACDGSPKVGDVFAGFSPQGGRWVCAFQKNPHNEKSVPPKEQDPLLEVLAKA